VVPKSRDTRLGPFTTTSCAAGPPTAVARATCSAVFVACSTGRSSCRTRDPAPESVPGAFAAHRCTGSDSS
jgi:hypothetical protein